MSKYTVFDCFTLGLHRYKDRTGNLTAVENFKDIPFEIKRVYYLYDVPGGESRGAHGHKDLEQLIVAASGSFDVSISDGANKKTVNLNRPYIGLYLKPGMWRELHNFSSGAIVLVLASGLYNEDDYLRNFDDFQAYKKTFSQQ
ncbi:sugar 3,4-ketoisomerase [Mucilaginibacter sp.]